MADSFVCSRWALVSPSVMLNACCHEKERILKTVVLRLETAHFVFEIVGIHDTDALAGVGELTYITTEEDWLAGLDRL
jgi:hypothetical protein